MPEGKGALLIFKAVVRYRLPWYDRERTLDWRRWTVLIYLTFIPLTGVLFLLLYREGLMVTKCIAAVLFVFRPGKHGDRVSLDSCTGWVRHAGRFRESRTYQFQFDYQLSKGSAEVILLDRQKQELLRLTKDKTTAELPLSRNARYYLRWEFKGATGKCELRW